MKKGDTYICASCGGTFTATAGDDETFQECKENFGLTPDQIPCDVICDKCYQNVCRWIAQQQQRN